MPPLTTTYHDTPPHTTIHYQPKYIHHHPPPLTISQKRSTTTNYHPPPSTTTTHHRPKYIYHHPKNGPPPSKSQNIFMYNFLLILLQQFLFLRNAIFFSVTETSCDKVLKFQISTLFYNI